jgi:hypothetical protein
MGVGKLKFELVRDGQGFSSAAPKAQSYIGTTESGVWVDNVVLAANVAQTYTIPAWANCINLSATGNLYVTFGGATAAIPGANVIDGTGSIINPSARGVIGGSSISLLSPVACIVSIEVWQ